MREMHPEDHELAILSDGEAGAEEAEHMQWCARCRRSAADYRWLRGEIAATLTAVAGAVGVPRSNWWAVRERAFAGQHPTTAKWWLPGFAGVAVALCLMLSVLPCLGTAVVSQTLSPEVLIAPAPTGALFPGGQLASVATATPVVREAPDASLTPAIALPPTPPRPGAVDP